MHEVAVVGLDLAKNVFQVHGIDAAGVVVAQAAAMSARGRGRRPCSAWPANAARERLAPWAA